MTSAKAEVDPTTPQPTTPIFMMGLQPRSVGDADAHSLDQSVRRLYRSATWEQQSLADSVVMASAGFRYKACTPGA